MQTMADYRAAPVDAAAPASVRTFDPVFSPEYFEGVLTRRVIAFLLDVCIITIPIVVACLFIALFGIVTLGLGWALFWLVSPAAVIWPVVYYGMTLGGPHSATLGMRAVDIEMRTWNGRRAYFLLGAVHAIIYWISVSALTPLVLLVAFFNRRRRLLQDFLLGTVIVNTEERATRIRGGPAVTPIAGSRTRPF
jgi:uncharacterized RDD family membrane protein YckC